MLTSQCVGSACSWAGRWRSCSGFCDLCLKPHVASKSCEPPSRGPGASMHGIASARGDVVLDRFACWARAFSSARCCLSSENVPAMTLLNLLRLQAAVCPARQVPSRQFRIGMASAWLCGATSASESLNEVWQRTVQMSKCCQLLCFST